MSHARTAMLVFSTLSAAFLVTPELRAMSVTFMPSSESPVSVGTLVRYSAYSVDAGSDSRYRFRVRRLGRSYQLIRDYSPSNFIDWTASASEGTYEIEVSMRDLHTGDIASASERFQFTPVVDGDQAVVSPTGNSLVFLYSAPPCRNGERMRAEFFGSDGVIQQTPYKNCNALSMNFYLAGIRAESEYTARHVLDTGSAFTVSPGTPFTSGTPPDGLYASVVLSPPPGGASNPVLLGSPIGARPVAHDLKGNAIWYGPDDISYITRPEPGGNMWGLILSGDGVDQQIVRRFDLAGMTLTETNAARVNEQLERLGKRRISSFHHEATPLPGGRVAVLAGVEQILDDVQGPGPVDVLGDMIIVLDRDMNVTWTWDTFDFLDVRRLAVLGEMCPRACPPTALSPVATDWTHGNSVHFTPDGNFLFSSRHQDWLIKVSYESGEGDGHVIWRMGKDGDFVINSADPFPWFSHQHDGNFVMSDPTKLLVFDNGNTRLASFREGNSRGQVFAVDEKAMTVTPLLNADLGIYSQAVGSAQNLRDGNYHFDAGFVIERGSIDSYSIGVDKSGQTVYKAFAEVILYRSFRMTNMYTPN